jgi:hypothetical protein
MLFHDAWRNVLYRFRSCEESEQSFVASVEGHGDMPPDPERYYQERDLFAFFVTGLATIESLAFAAYVLGHLIRPQYFCLGTKPPQVTPRQVGDLLAKHFPLDALTAALNRVLDDPEFQVWKDVRNTLAHRGCPPRTAYEGEEKPTDWFCGVTLDKAGIGTRAQWLERAVERIAKGIDGFASQHL